MTNRKVSWNCKQRDLLYKSLGNICDLTGVMCAMKLIIKRRTVISELMRNARSINLSRVSVYVCICACSSTRINFSWNFRHLRNIPISEYTAKADGSKYEILLSGTGTRGEFFPNWVYIHVANFYFRSYVMACIYDASIMDDSGWFYMKRRIENVKWNLFFSFSRKSNSSNLILSFTLINRV